MDGFTCHRPRRWRPSPATAKPEWKPEVDVPPRSRGGICVATTDLRSWSDLFTPRQLVALTTFSDLVQEAREHVKRDALAAGSPDDGKPLAVGGAGATAYADAVGVYFGFLVDRCADYWSYSVHTMGAGRSDSHERIRAPSDSDGVGLRRS